MPFRARSLLKATLAVAIFAGLAIAIIHQLRARAELAQDWYQGNTEEIQPPKAQFYVTVDKDVRVQVVDWGGSGRPLVFLPGLGSTARSAFDRFAPKFVSGYHVYGITRRGFGSSSRPDTGYSADRLGDDVVAVLDALKLHQPVLVGHSIGGQELSSVGSRYPERIAGLVYLDAAYDYAFYSPTIPERNTPLNPKLPAPVRAILEGKKRYTDLRVPVLAIYAIPTDLSWRYPNDPSALAKAEAEEIARNGPQAQAFAKGVPSARVINIPRANHFVFFSHEDRVLHEMRTFLETLR
ncbi:Tropinesterase [Lacunisphaera limnophila]|uniref:Tropinesterase n=2 Tax=Lacunisphaera limnophila TaxID=1838286 RepID=A0A1D8AZL0_9BACT|nr:Tropinesterase [Lacunisphaera limnophila]